MTSQAHNLVEEKNIQLKKSATLFKTVMIAACKERFWPKGKFG